MLKQYSPNKWSCLPTAFAMVIDRYVEDLIKDIGHDGSEIIWPELPEPYCRRSFHIQEILQTIWGYGVLAMPIQVSPVSMSHGSTRPYRVPVQFSPETRFRYIMTLASGVLIGETQNGQPHAVAWDGNKIFDPNGTTYGIESFVLETFWLVKTG
jgi:hypothetical protein